MLPVAPSTSSNVPGEMTVLPQQDAELSAWAATMETWSTTFDHAQLYLTESAADGVYLPVLRGWGFQMALDAKAAYCNEPGVPDKYLDICKGDWVVPQWQEDSKGDWDIAQEQGWSLVRKLGHDGTVETG